MRYAGEAFRHCERSEAIQCLFLVFVIYGRSNEVSLDCFIALLPAMTPDWLYRPPARRFPILLFPFSQPLLALREERKKEKE